MMNGLRDALLQTAAAKVTTAGDLVYATGANALARLGIGTALSLLRTNAAGTAPEWFTPPACRVYHSTSQSVATGTDTAVQFDSERFDNAALHDTATNNTRVTAPIAGVYALTASLVFGTSNAGHYTARLRLNGSTRIAYDSRTLPSGALDAARVTIGTVYKLAAGDYVEVMAEHFTGASNTVTSHEFAAAWLGPG